MMIPENKIKNKKEKKIIASINFGEFFNASIIMLLVVQFILSPAPLFDAY